MKLLTKTIEKLLPALKSQDGKDPATVKVPLKLFHPVGNWTWFLTEYDPETREFFGLVQGHEIEYGYVSLDELETVVGRMGLKIERDLHWDPNTTLADVRKSLGMPEIIHA